MPIPSTPAGGSAASAAAADLSRLISETSGPAEDVSPAWPITPNFPFFLMHWVTDWTVETAGMAKGKPTWLPGLVRHIVLPGCNNNRTLKNGEKATAAYDGAVMKNVRQGAQYLDPERHKLANGSKYSRKAPARSPLGQTGFYFFDAFSSPLDVLPGRKMRFRFDRPEWNRWRLHLVESGVIAPPSPQVLAETQRRHSKRAERTRALTSLDQKEYDRRVAAAAATSATYDGALVPKSKTRRASSSLSSPGRVPSPDDAEAN